MKIRVYGSGFISLFFQVLNSHNFIHCLCNVNPFVPVTLKIEKFGYPNLIYYLSDKSFKGYRCESEIALLKGTVRKKLNGVQVNAELNSISIATNYT